MTSERRTRILAMLGTSGGETPETKRLCEVCAEATGASGAGIMLITGALSQGSICTSDAVAQLVEQLQYDLGEGPCIDAHREDRPVLEPDLVDPATLRWQAFSGPAIAAGVRAIFGFPLRVGSVRLGALNLYRDAPGPLTDDQHADALVVASVAAQAVLVLQNQAPDGQLAVGIESNANFAYVVHQAAGMASVQLGVNIEHALIRLRAYAFANDQRVADVAAAVVARTLRFEPDSEDST